MKQRHHSLLGLLQNIKALYERFEIEMSMTQPMIVVLYIDSSITDGWLLTINQNS